MYSDERTRRGITQLIGWQGVQFGLIPDAILPGYRCNQPGTNGAENWSAIMSDREAKARAVKILAKSIFRDLEAQGFDEKQIVALATELISEVTSKMSARGSSPDLQKSRPLA